MLDAAQLSRLATAVTVSRPASQRGQSAVEFAMVLPVILLTISGLFDFGRLAYSQVTVASAAHVGAQYGSVSPAYASDAVGIESVARSEANGLWNTSGANPTVNSSTGTDASGMQYVTVVVSYTFSSLFPYPGLPSQLSLMNTVQMRVQP